MPVRSIIIVDTSIFLNIIDVPGRNQRRDKILDDLAGLSKDRSVSLLLPHAAILETGNHISYLANGYDRWKFSKIFIGR